MLHWVDNNLRHESDSGRRQGLLEFQLVPERREVLHPFDPRVVLWRTIEFGFDKLSSSAVRTRATPSSRSAICGIYNGPTPGGLSCHMYADGRQRMNDEFADAISMWGRAVVEGMYGIRPERPRGVVELSPQFPSTWSEASIKTPQFTYRWKREGRRILVEWESPVATAVELRLPLRVKQVDEVMVDGKATPYRLDPGVGLTWLNLRSPSGRHGAMSVACVPAEPSAPQQITWKEGDQVDLKLVDYSASGFLDPQGVLRDGRMENGVLRGTAAGEIGDRLMFLKSGGDARPFWTPLTVHIESHSRQSRRFGRRRW